jgi:2-succinyl-6-hydroxy-2,4-cyclohexadiene-1-carboxylate synthase
MTPTVLLLHGFTHTGGSWEPVVAALGESYRAITPDLRGHGAASAAVPVTLETVLEDLEPYAKDERVTLVGYSMGGRIGLHCALAWPERVRHLVLIGASPGLADPAERAQRRSDDDRLADEIEGSTIEGFARRWALTPVLSGLPDAARERVHADRLRNTPVGLARALRGLGTGALPSLWERLNEVKMPVSLIIGERDEKFRGVGERMAKSIPAAELVVVPDAGHAVHLEAPDRVAEIIRRS